MNKKFLSSVLIVDDQFVNRLITSRFLQLYGVSNYCVSNASDAIKACSQFQFDLILLDIHMPEMNGFMAIHVLRKHTNATIVAYTSDASESTTESVKTHGFDAYLQKPFNPEMFLEILRNKMALN